MIDKVVWIQSRIIIPYKNIRNVREAVSKSQVLVRVNPIHKNHVGYFDSEEEIGKAVEAGADIIMLPFFHTVQEVGDFPLFCEAGKMKNIISRRSLVCC